MEGILMAVLVLAFSAFGYYAVDILGRFRDENYLGYRETEEPEVDTEQSL